MIELTPENEEKQRAFKEAFIKTPIVESVLDDFDRLRYNKKFGGEQQCMLLTGDTGAGKTALLDYYKAQHEDNASRGFVECPVLLSRIPSPPNLDAVIKQLLHDLDVFGATKLKRTKNALNDTSLLIENLRIANTQLIIIDEFQELVEYKTGQNLQEIANRLKYINEEAKVAIVLVGMPWADRIAGEPGWSSRLMTRKFIPYFKLSDEVGVKNFITVLLTLSAQMPFAKPVERAFFSKSVIYQLFAACKGRFRWLRHLLDEAVKIALYRNAETLAVEHLSDAYSTIFYEDNPFQQDPDTLKAQEVAEYSRYKFDAATPDETITETKFIDTIPFSQLFVKTTRRKKPGPK